MSFRRLQLTLDLTPEAVSLPPAPPAPAPVPPAPAPPAAARPEAPAPELTPGPPWPAGLEAGAALAVAELGGLEAVAELGTLPVPFALRCSHGQHTLYITWHTSTHTHLLHQQTLVLDATEWAALALGAHEGRAADMPTHWLEMKVRHSQRRITPHLSMSGAVPDTHTHTLTISQVCKAWGLNLTGLAYGPA